MLNTVRVPLSAFGGINLSDVRSVQFRFDQTAWGALLFTDLAFADSGVPPTLPDLVKTAVSNPPGTVTQGGSFPVTDTVQNQGAGSAGASTTRYYLSLDTTKSSADKLLGGARSVKTLAAGASSTGHKHVKVKAAIPPGVLDDQDVRDAVGALRQASHRRATAGSTRDARAAGT